MWNVIIPAAAGYIMDKSQGGKGWKGAAIGAAGGYAGGKGAPGGSILGDTAANTTATGLNSGNLLTSGGAGNALGLESAVASQAGNAGGMIPIDFNNTQSYLNNSPFGPELPNRLGVDLMSNSNAGLPLETGFDSGLTEVGSNAGYQPGDPFYNPQDAFMQNQDIINEDMFKPTTEFLDGYGDKTMGLSIDDNGVVQHNPTDMELFQPKGTDRELTMQDYAERGMDKFGKMVSKTGDYLYDNPDKVIMGGLSVASMLEGNNKSQIQQTSPAGFKQANLSGLTAPNSNGQYVYRPQQKRSTLLG